MKDNLVPILKEVANLYFEYGIRSVTMDDIAQNLGISKKTLYLHFKNKKDLVEQSLRWRMENPNFSFNKETNVDCNAIDWYLKFHSFISEHIKSINNSLEYDLRKYYPYLFKELYQRKIDNITININRNLRQGVKENLFRSDLNIEIISKMLVNLYINFWKNKHHYFSPEQLESNELDRQLTIYHLKGICSKQGLEYIKLKIQATNNL